jgi:type I restriction-modification system DNA methylase subunit
MNTSNHFEPILSKVFDHLYANAQHRTPGSIELEIRKLIQTAIYIERNINPLQPAFSATLEEKKILKQDPKAAAAYAKTIRDAYCKAETRTEAKDSSREIFLSDFDLVYCCLEFSGISFSLSERDLFGDSVELFRSHWSKSQGGQFFTDQRVTTLALDLLDFNGGAGESLVDLCSGTGGFIIAALKRLSSRSTKIQGKYTTGMISKVQGYEADQSVASVGNEAVSALTGITCSPIQVANSLTLGATPNSNQNGSALGNITHAATNPPFGAKILVKDPEILGRFALTKQRRQHDLKPLPLDVLFIEQNYNILCEGGKLAIVLPFQTLSGPQSTWIREWILERFQLVAIIDLPSETFQPYTGTKTSLIIMEKRTGGAKSQTQPVFMACPQHIGHDRRGNPVWRKDHNGRELDEVLTDLPSITEIYKKWKELGQISKDDDLCYQVPIGAIFANSDLRIDARFYQPSLAEAKMRQLRSRSGFNVKKLGDVCSRIFYPGRFRRSYTNDLTNSVPFLGGTNISQLILATEKRIDVRDVNYDKLKVEKGWILITRSGSTGIVSSVADNWDGYAISEHVIRIVPDREKINPDYLYAFLQTHVAQDYIRRGVFGSVIDELSPDYLAEMEILIPKESAMLEELSHIVSHGLKARNQAAHSLTLANEKLNQLFGVNSAKR